MRRSRSFALTFVLAGLPGLALAQAPPPATRPTPAPPPPPPAVKVGDTAPDFTLPYLVAKAEGGFERRQVRLADFRGKQNVVVAFFPAAFSPG